MKFDGAVIISGGFDPIHIGHLRMIKDAAKLGTKLIVIANCDRFLMDKKGYAFMSIEERLEILEGFEGVHRACLLYTSPSPRDLSTSRMPSSA